jgi:hypothetical protein
MATQVDLGKIRPVWKGNWAASTAYEQNDMVKEGVDSYICIAAHTSGSTFADTNWDILALGAEIPAQTGYAGKALITDGTNMSWGDGGKVLQANAYYYSSRATFAHDNNWQTYLSGTFNKQSSSSLVVAQIVMSTFGEYNGSGLTRFILGSTSEYGQYDYGISGHSHAHSRLFRFTSNTQTGSLSWQYQQNYNGIRVINPNTNEDSRINAASPSVVVITEYVQ